MVKLSKAQERALRKFKNGERLCAYKVQESLATLNRLVELGYLKSYIPYLGAYFSPRTAIKFEKRLEKF